MAFLRTTVTGSIALPDGSPMPDGAKIIFTLRGWDKNADTVAAPGLIEATVQAGAISVQLIRTASTARKTTYDVGYAYWNPDAGKAITGQLGTIAISGAATRNIAELLALPAPVPNVPDALAQALAATAAGITAANSANAAALLALTGTGTGFDSVQQLLGSTITYGANTITHNGGTVSLTVAAGDRWTTKEGIVYQVAAPGATDHHVTTAGGVRLYVQVVKGEVHFDAFPQTAAGFVAAARVADAAGAVVRLSDGKTYILGTVNLDGSLRIRGKATLHQTGNINLGASATALEIYDVRFTKSGDGIGLLAPTAVALTKVRILNAEVAGGIGFHLRGRASDVLVQGCTFDNLRSSGSSCNAVLIGANNPDDTFNSRHIRIIGNTIRGVYTPNTSECHAFLIYGREITIQGNTVIDVTQPDPVGSASPACEAIYTKGVRVTITGNVILNCKPSEDGAITLKGSDYSTEAADGNLGFEATVTGNIIAYDLNNTTPVNVGIMSFIANATISGNTLRNTYLKVAGENNLVTGNVVDVIADGYAGRVYHGEFYKPGVTVRGNKFRLVSRNYNVNTYYAAYVRAITAVSSTASTAYPVSKFEFSDNDCEITLEGMTTGAANWFAFLQLGADTADVESALVKNNVFRINLPALIGIRTIVGYSGAGVNAIDATFRNNETIITAPLVANTDLRSYHDSGGGPRKLEFTGNRSKVIPVLANPTVLVSSYDVTCNNLGATGVNRLNLSGPTAIPGNRIRVIAGSREHGILVRPAGSAWHDGSTADRTLSAGGSMILECFEAGFWTVTSLTGTFA